MNILFVDNSDPTVILLEAFGVPRIPETNEIVHLRGVGKENKKYVVANVYTVVSHFPNATPAPLQIYTFEVWLSELD